MKQLDDLNFNELLDVAIFIENNPHKAAKKLWPNEPARVKYARKVKNYCRNKAVALHSGTHDKQKYISIVVDIWIDLPDVFKSLNIDLVPRR